jgi:hypothetical protein
MAQANVDSGHEHFREEDWLDFARDVGDSAHRVRVAQHLEAGCSECEQTLRLWAAVLSVADQATQAGPPDFVVDRMKERFSLRRPKKLRERLAHQAALIFDSFRQPMLAGMRASAGSPARQLLYKAGRYTIKLQVQAGAGEGQTSIVGQILDDRDPSGAMRDIAVLALCGNKTLDRTVTNPLGEFQLEPHARGKLQLAVDVPEIGTFTVEPPRRLATSGEGADAADAKAAPGAGRGNEARPRKQAGRRDRKASSS